MESKASIDTSKIKIRTDENYTPKVDMPNKDKKDIFKKIELYRFSQLCSEKMNCGIYGCRKKRPQNGKFF